MKKKKKKKGDEENEGKKNDKKKKTKKKMKKKKMTKEPYCLSNLHSSQPTALGEARLDRATFSFRSITTPSCREDKTTIRHCVCKQCRWPSIGMTAAGY